MFPRKPVQTDVGIDDIVNRVNAASATAKIAEGVSKAAAVVDGRPACVPPLPTESAKDELEMLDISKKPAEPEKPKKKEPELPPVKEPDPVPDVPDEDEEEPVIESQPTYRKPPITCLKELSMTATIISPMSSNPTRRSCSTRSKASMSTRR